MERMRPPLVPEQPVAVLTEPQIEALLRACQGTAFEDRRDEAIIRLLLDTAMRSAPPSVRDGAKSAQQSDISRE